METDLNQRTNLLTSEHSQPECLNPVWELFMMCEKELLNNEYFEVDDSYIVKMKQHDDELYYPHGRFLKYQSATKIQSVWRGYNSRNQ